MGNGWEIRMKAASRLPRRSQVWTASDNAKLFRALEWLC